jgi:hypothetical protein
MLMKQIGESVTRETDTIQISRSLGNQARKVTDDSLIAGQHTGSYEALCGHRASAAALATPLGRACAECAVVSAAQQRVRTVRLGRRSRHGQSGWLRRILYPRRTIGTDVGGW